MKDNACVQVEDTRHPTETSPMRPEVGTQACFNLNKPRQTYRYDSSLSPALQWDGQHREGKPDYRWVKRFRGVRYRVTCESLGLPRDGWTKEDSWQAANQWWQDHLAELLSPAWRKPLCTRMPVECRYETQRNPQRIGAPAPPRR